MNASAGPLFQEEEVRKIRSRFFATLPLYIMVPAALAIAFMFAGGHAIDWKAFGLGAAGWFAALLLRGPIAALVMKLPQSAAQTIIVSSSGVLEESVRLILLGLTAATLSEALSIGQGWAAIEVIYTIIAGLATLSLLGRTDDKAKQAQAMLAAQGTAHLHPIWGVAERLFASLFHIGATLLIAAEPWLAAVLIPVHSLLNLSALWLMKRSILLVEGLIAVVGTGVMLAGWLLFQ